MFFLNILGEKNLKCGSGGRKSTYCDTTDNQSTAQRVKLGLNPLPLLLIHHKYKREVGKLSGWFFTAAFWAKIVRNLNQGSKIDILLCDRFPTYRSTSQIRFKSFPIASSRSQIHTRIRKTITNVFFPQNIGRKISEIWIWETKIDIL